MAGNFSLGIRSGAALLAAAFGLSVVGLAPASCTLDVHGTRPEPASTGGGGQGPGTGTGGSTSTGTNSGGGGQGGEGGAIPPPPEACLDGVDNDEDGLIDCADTDDCAPAEYECAPAPPVGWAVNVRAAAVPYGETLPDCEAGSTNMDYFAGPSPAACTECDCDWDSNGASCYAPTVTCWSGPTDCSGTGTTFTDLTNNNCLDLSGAVLNSGSCRITGAAAVQNAGTCAIAPGGGELTIAAPWSEAVRVCAGSAAGGGCEANQVCVPRSTTGATPLEGAVCLQKEGTDACPDGWTDVDKQLYTNLTEDTRACTECACGQVGCTGGMIRAHSRSACSFMGDQTNLSTNCANLDDYFNNGTFSLFPTAATPTPPSCEGGVASGEVMTEGPVKLCCRQQP